MEEYYVVSADGTRYGPAQRDTLYEWNAEGRLTPETWIENIGTGERILVRTFLALSQPSSPLSGMTPAGVSGAERTAVLRSVSGTVEEISSTRQGRRTLDLHRAGQSVEKEKGEGKTPFSFQQLIERFHRPLPEDMPNTSGRDMALPAGVLPGYNLGAFAFPAFWLIAMKESGWGITLLVLSALFGLFEGYATGKTDLFVPLLLSQTFYLVSMGGSVYLAARGDELAWRWRKFADLPDWDRCQKRWAAWAYVATPFVAAKLVMTGLAMQAVITERISPNLGNIAVVFYVAPAIFLLVGPIFVLQKNEGKDIRAIAALILLGIGLGTGNMVSHFPKITTLVIGSTRNEMVPTPIETAQPVLLPARPVGRVPVAATSVSSQFGFALRSWQEGSGAFIEAVVPGTPAGRAGVPVGLAIVRIEGDAVNSPMDVDGLILKYPQNGTVRLYLREHATSTEVPWVLNLNAR